MVGELWLKPTHHLEVRHEMALLIFLSSHWRGIDLPLDFSFGTQDLD